MTLSRLFNYVWVVSSFSLISTCSVLFVVGPVGMYGEGVCTPPRISFGH